MRTPHSLQDVIRADLCISCGACVSAAPAGSIEMVLDESRGVSRPEIRDASVTGRGPELEVCPGKGLPILEMAEELFGCDLVVSFELGRYRQVLAAHSADAGVLENASSGGVMTEVAAYLLEQKRVDGVLISTFVYGEGGPRVQTVIARRYDELIAGQGSKYCPTTTNALVGECVRAGGQYLFIGTPCQVAALRLAMRQDLRVKQTFPLAMASFCGGYRDYRDLDGLISRHGLDPAQVTFFRFRGGGQPGSMLIRSSDGREASEPYPEYGRHAQLPKQKRCTFCIDATGELADLSCGDAWIPRYTGQSMPWSIVLIRSRYAADIVSAMSQEGRLVTEIIEPDEVIYSQRQNLESKKYRQKKRMAVSALARTMMPSWDAPLPDGNGSYLQEARILTSKFLKRLSRALVAR